MPYEYIEYRLLKEFNWSLQELYSVSDNKIGLFLKFIDIEHQFENRGHSSSRDIEQIKNTHAKRK